MPEPAAMRLRRLRLMMAELWRSLEVMELMMASMRVNWDSSTLGSMQSILKMLPSVGPFAGLAVRMIGKCSGFSNLQR
jgi:hypothetical protein